MTDRDRWDHVLNGKRKKHRTRREKVNAAMRFRYVGGASHDTLALAVHDVPLLEKTCCRPAGPWIGCEMKHMQGEQFV